TIEWQSSRADPRGQQTKGCIDSRFNHAGKQGGAKMTCMGLRRGAVIAFSALAMLTCAGTAFADSMADLVIAAKKEGQLTIIALPHDWCGYGAVIEGFKARYGLKLNELDPDAGSAVEIEQIKSNKGNTGPQAPDVIDVGLSFGPS